MYIIVRTNIIQYNMRMKPMFNIFYTVCITISCPRWIIINMCPIESRTSVFCFFLYFFFTPFSFSTTSSSFLSPYIEIYVPRSEYTPRVYVCIYVIILCTLPSAWAGVRAAAAGVLLYSMWYGCDCMWARPDYPTANSYQRQRCVWFTVYQPGSHVRTDVYIFTFLSSSYIKIHIHIWCIIILSAWVYKVLHNVIISAARANIVLIWYTLYTCIRHGTSFNNLFLHVIGKFFDVFYFYFYFFFMGFAYNIFINHNNLYIVFSTNPFLIYIYIIQIR